MINKEGGTLSVLLSRVFIIYPSSFPFLLSFFISVMSFLCFSSSPFRQVRSFHTHTHARTHARTQARTHTHTHHTCSTHAHTRTRTHARTHAHTHAGTH